MHVMLVVSRNILLHAISAQESALLQRALQQALQRHVDYPRVRRQPAIYHYSTLM